MRFDTGCDLTSTSSTCDSDAEDWGATKLPREGSIWWGCGGPRGVVQKGKNPSMIVGAAKADKNQQVWLRFLIHRVQLKQDF